MQLRSCKLVLAGTAFFTVAAPAFSNGLYDDGVRDYLAAKYDQAAVELAKATDAQPHNALAHYYLANSLVHIQKHDQAIAEYRLCYALDPYGAVSSYCKQALASYREKLPTREEIEKVRDTAYGSGAETAAGKISLAARPSASQEPQLERSLSIIRRQVQTEKEKDDSLADSTSQDAMSQAKKAVQTLHENTEVAIQKLYASQPRRTAYLGRNLEARAQQLRDQAKEEEAYIMRDAELKAQRYKQIGEWRKSALDQVADNLEKQMTDDGRYSGVRLVPEHTNLYVRNYASAPTVRAVPDAHSAVARIYADHSGAGVPAAAASQQAEPFSRKAVRSVRGKIVEQPN